MPAYVIPVHIPGRKTKASSSSLGLSGNMLHLSIQVVQDFFFSILCQIWYFNVPGIWLLSLDFIADMLFFSLIFYSHYLGNYSLLQDIVLFIGGTAVMS